MQSYNEIGTAFLESLWYSFACRIVDRAIEVYGVDADRASEIKAAFLKRGDYCVLPL